MPRRPRGPAAKSPASRHPQEKAPGWASGEGAAVGPLRIPRLGSVVTSAGTGLPVRGWPGREPGSLAVRPAGPPAAESRAEHVGKADPEAEVPDSSRAPGRLGGGGLPVSRLPFSPSPRPRETCSPASPLNTCRTVRSVEIPAYLAVVRLGNVKFIFDFQYYIHNNAAGNINACWCKRAVSPR